MNKPAGLFSSFALLSSTMSSTKLFTPQKLGHVTLGHRIALSPMTRFGDLAGPLTAPHVLEYYTSRSSVPGTLLITEATVIFKEAGGFPFPLGEPNLYEEDKIVAWKKVGQFILPIDISFSDQCTNRS